MDSFMVMQRFAGAIENSKMGRTEKKGLVVFDEGDSSRTRLTGRSRIGNGRRGNALGECGEDRVGQQCHAGRQAAGGERC